VDSREVLIDSCEDERWEEVFLNQQQRDEDGRLP